jgi:hypothetical protein
MLNTEQKIDLSSFLIICKKKIGIIVIVFVFFLGIAVYLNYFTKKVYKVNFTINSSIVINQSSDNKTGLAQNRISQGVIEGIIKNFNALYNYKKEYASIDEDTFQVKPMNFKNIEIIPSITETNFLEISAEIFDLSTLNNTMEEFVQFVNKNEYVQRSFSTEKNKLSGLKTRYIEQIKQMEELKSSLYSKGNAIQFNIYKDIVLLEEKLAELNSTYNNLNGFNVVVKPVLPLKPEDFSPPILFFLLGFTGLMCGIILALILDKIKFS